MGSSRTQIVATIGPATGSLSMIRQLTKSGMDVVRLNFAHGTFEEHRQVIEYTRMVANELGKHIPIIGDLAGPRLHGEHSHKYDSDAIYPFTDYDIESIAFNIEQNIDYTALSYAGSASDIEELHDLLHAGGSGTRIIAKIERIEALRNLDGIIETSDAVMIARGDLGNEIPLEQIPYVQHSIIKKMNWVHKPVITATEMLLSMVRNTTPTRAEVSDVAYAVISGTDAVMLSEETAVGNNPVEAVTMMEKVVLEAERHILRDDTHLL